MHPIRLHPVTSAAPEIGFGCASLTAGNDRKYALSLLRTAYEQGITHFDVARAYGLGHAEGILGEFIRDKRDRVTITTKFGIQPRLPLANSASAIGMVKRIVRRVPGLKSVLQRSVQQFVQTGAFGAREAAASLQKSLRELQTDYVDVLLLHECTLADARSEELLAFLEDQVRAGTIRYYGIGTNIRQLGGDLARFPAAYSVFQFEHPFGNDPGAPRNGSDRYLITHSVLKELDRIHAAALAQPAAAQIHLGEAQVDLRDRDALAAMLLHAALRTNPGGTVLFATTKREHLLSNLRRVRELRLSTDALAALAQFTGAMTPVAAPLSPALSAVEANQQ